MNATETIFALALASNCNPKQNFETAFEKISSLGQVQFSKIYEIPCRDGIGADYWNAACLVHSFQSVEDIIMVLKKMEAESGRIRPSHHISLDVDLIAWGKTLSEMQFNEKKLPLALDVKVPMFDLWKCAEFKTHLDYPIVSIEI